MSDPRHASGYSSFDLISMGFIATPRLAAFIENTSPVSAIDATRFDAIMVAGGQAPMFTFDKATELHEKFVEFYEGGKIASALCHGVAMLVSAAASGHAPRETFVLVHGAWMGKAAG
jgi:putative intracellular protease/amidase